MRREIENVKEEQERLSYFNLISAITGIYFDMSNYLSNNCVNYDSTD